MMRPPLALLTLILFVPVAADAVIHACPMGMTATLPPDGAQGVPTNAVIRVTYQYTSRDQDPYALFEGADKPVDGDWALAFEPDHLTSVWAFTPAEPLLPNQQYHLSHPEGRTGRPGRLAAMFTTGSGADLEAPAVPDILGARYRAGRSRWGRWRYHHLTLSATEEQGWFEVDIASNRHFDDARTIQAHPPRWVDEAFWEQADEVQGVFAGYSICEGNAQLDSGERWVRVRVIDMAGNVSASSEIQRPSGCSVMAGPASAVAWMLPLAALFARRSRVPTSRRGPSARAAAMSASP